MGVLLRRSREQGLSKAAGIAAGTQRPRGVVQNHVRVGMRAILFQGTPVWGVRRRRKSVRYQPVQQNLFALGSRDVQTNKVTLSVLNQTHVRRLLAKAHGNVHATLIQVVAKGSLIYAFLVLPIAVSMLLIL